MKIALTNLADTDALAARIASGLQAGDVVALTGDLGAGKTTLARAILRALGYQGEVPSPTFTLLESYRPPALRLPVVHADFYRLSHPAEVEELGLDDYRYDAALLAEWPENAGGFAHEAQCLSVKISANDSESGDKGRIAIVEPGQDWLTRFV